MGVLPEALFWIKKCLFGFCPAGVLPSSSPVTPARVAAPVGCPQCPASTSSHCQWPHGQRGGQNATVVPSCSTLGQGFTAQSQPSMVRAGVCIALSPRFMLEGGSVTRGLVSVVQRDLLAEDAELQPPLCLAHCSVPPSHQHHLLPLSRSLIQLFPQYGLWSQTIPTWQLSWRGWWKSGKEIHW